MTTPTIEDARAWAETSEQFTFCIDWLGISAWARTADQQVDDLEREFERLLAAEEALS